MRKGVAIAINQIVIFIIGIVVFTLGIVMISQIFNTSEQILPQIDEKFKAQLERTLSDGDLVEIPLSTKHGSAKDLTLYHLVLRNDPGVYPNHVDDSHLFDNDFIINITSNGHLDRFGNLDEDDAFLDLLLLNPQWESHSTHYNLSINMNVNSVESFALGISPSDSAEYAGPGQYTYQVDVYKVQRTQLPYETKPYDTVTFSLIVD